MFKSRAQNLYCVYGCKTIDEINLTLIWQYSICSKLFKGLYTLVLIEKIENFFIALSESTDLAALDSALSATASHLQVRLYTRLSRTLIFQKVRLR